MTPVRGTLKSPSELGTSVEHMLLLPMNLKTIPYKLRIHIISNLCGTFIKGNIIDYVERKELKDMFDNSTTSLKFHTP